MNDKELDEKMANFIDVLKLITSLVKSKTESTRRGRN